MASYAQLQNDIAAWLDRRDLAPLIPGWVAMAETDISEQLRARCMVTRGVQPVDAAFITLPPDFASMESIRDATTGHLLRLEDEFTGPPGPNPVLSGPTTAYRLVGDCIEFLPHPYLPPLPWPPGWLPQSVNMNWYRRPRPLVELTDTNPVLEQLYSVYLFKCCQYGAMYELDDDRAKQMSDAFDAAVFKANLWKQLSDYSGAPLRAVVRSF